MAEGDSFGSFPSDLRTFLDVGDPGFFPEFPSLGNAQFDQFAEGHAYLEILEQPKQRGFRFRYPCEGPSHGGLPGERSQKGKKTYPAVQINNYVGRARIEVTLVTISDPPCPHAHSLVGKNVQDGAYVVEVNAEQGMTASFPNLGIQHVTKKKVKEVLKERYLKQQTLQAMALSGLNIMKPEASGGQVQMDCDGASASNTQTESFDKVLAKTVAVEENKKIDAIIEEQGKNMNLSAVRLCFQTYIPDEQGNFVRCLPPVYSQQIYDSKAAAASELKICRMDCQAGVVTGGDEVFLLCDKVQKEDIEIRFFEERNGRDWEEFGKFSTSDVHRQYAIVFKTPPYWNTAIEKPVTVQLELRRKTDRERSNPMEFIYKPQEFDPEHIGAKRRKKVPHFGDYSDQGGGGSGMGGAGGGGGPPMFNPFLDPSALSQLFSMYQPGGPSGAGGGGPSENAAVPSGTTAGHSATSPCPSGTSSSTSGMTAGPSGANYSRSGTSSGHFGTSSGHSGTSSGHSGTSSGHSGTSSGHSDTSSGTRSGASGTTAGHSGTSIGPSRTTAGHYGTRSGSSSTTAVSSSITACPSSTTAAPSSTTAAPSSTTAAPSSTTAAPSSTTAAPSSTTAAPYSTTAAPSSITAAPYSTTAAPYSTTAGPYSTTTAPSSTTAAPSSTSAGPSSTTSAPSSTTAAPSGPGHGSSDTRHSTSDTRLSKKDTEQFLHFVNRGLHHAAATKKSFEHFSQSNDLRYLLAAQRHQTTLPNDDGDSALHIAIINRHRDIVTGILDVCNNNDIINRFNKLRQTPLHLAVITEQPRLIEKLLQAGADVTLQDRHGNTAFHLASQLKSPECLQTLVNPEATGGLTSGAGLDLQNYDGLTAVHLAVINNRLENLKILNSIGADMNAMDGKSGFSPLHHAVETNNLGLTGYLILTAKADINIGSIDGNTALHIASGRGLENITTLLVAAGASPDVVNNEEETPVDLATTCEVREVLEGSVGTSLVSVTSSRMADLSISEESDNNKDNLEQLDSIERNELESFVSSDWRSLAERLNLTHYLSALALQKNPARHLLDTYETIDGSIQRLRNALVELGNTNALRILDKCLGFVHISDNLPSSKNYLPKETDHSDVDSAYDSMATSGHSLPSLPSLRDHQKGLGNTYDIPEETVEPY